jgi:hypothetical protein
MVIEYDEKGKFYTDIITKDMILSHIQTHTHQIRGNVHVRKGDRLSDEINNANVFLAVTNAEIFSLLEALHMQIFAVIKPYRLVDAHR